MAARYGLPPSALPSVRSERAERMLAIAIGIVLVHLMDVAGWQLGGVATILLAVAVCPTSRSLRAPRTHRGGR